MLPVSYNICTFAAAKVVLRWPKAINMLKKSGLGFAPTKQNTLIKD